MAGKVFNLFFGFFGGFMFSRPLVVPQSGY